MKKNIEPYYVLNWDFNSDNVMYYDIMPYLTNCWKAEKKRKVKVWNVYGKEKNKMPETFEDFKNFILTESRYMFWARCEYEIIISGWPVKRNEVKIDVYQQIKANIDVITKHFMAQIK